MRAPREAVEAVFRQEHGKVFAALVRALGNFEAAEDALQEAFAVAMASWERDGIPARPGAWITTAARNSAVSSFRHDALATRKHLEIAADLRSSRSPDDDDIPDERLRLIFTCCHPALAEEARVALTLQTMCGLHAAAIARLFLVSEPTIAQRLVRAKRKIKASAIPFEVPPADRIDERLESVLAVVYLLFTEGYAASDGEPVVRRELCDEAIRLGRVLSHLLPSHPEAEGLLALMLLHDARREGRLDSNGEIIALEDQDRSRWNKAAIAEGTQRLDRALAAGAPGSYQIQAAIAALHASAPRAPDTDWPQIAGLYSTLLAREATPAVAVAFAFAEGMAHGPDRGLQRLDDLERSGLLAGSDRLAAARADLLRRAGRSDAARASYALAIAGARHARERRFLQRQLARIDRL